jgi:arylsulfatase A-like enzyme
MLWRQIAVCFLPCETFIFSSDNGPLSGGLQGAGGTDCAFFNSSAGRREGKATLYEGGIRAPCLVRWRGKVKAGRGVQMLRMGRWKLICKGERSAEGVGNASVAVVDELYDLADDPAETKNIAGRNAEIVALMKPLMAQQHRASVVFPMEAVDLY